MHVCVCLSVFCRSRISKITRPNFAEFSAHISSGRGSILHTTDDNAIGSESVPIQLAQCWFPGLALSNAKNIYIFRIKYTETNRFDSIVSNDAIKQHSETVKWSEITKMLIAVLRNKFIASFIIIFGRLSFPVGVVSPG